MTTRDRDPRGVLNAALLGIQEANRRLEHKSRAERLLDAARVSARVAMARRWTTRMEHPRNARQEVTLDHESDRLTKL